MEVFPPRPIKEAPPPAIAPISSISLISPRRFITSSVIAPVSSILLPSGIVTVMEACVLSISGINAVPFRRARTPLTINSANAPIRTNAFLLSTVCISVSYAAVIRSSNGCFLSLLFFSTPTDMAGTSVKAITRLASRE